jgi:hypothetical protein
LTSFPWSKAMRGIAMSAANDTFIPELYRAIDSD